MHKVKPTQCESARIEWFSGSRPFSRDALHADSLHVSGRCRACAIGRTSPSIACCNFLRGRRRRNACSTHIPPPLACARARDLRWLQDYWHIAPVRSRDWKGAPCRLDDNSRAAIKCEVGAETDSLREVRCSMSASQDLCIFSPINR